MPPFQLPLPLARHQHMHPALKSRPSLTRMTRRTHSARCHLVRPPMQARLADSSRAPAHTIASRVCHPPNFPSHSHPVSTCETAKESRNCWHSTNSLPSTARDRKPSHTRRQRHAGMGISQIALARTCNPDTYTSLPVAMPAWVGTLKRTRSITDGASVGRRKIMLREAPMNPVKRASPPTKYFPAKSCGWT